MHLRGGDQIEEIMGDDIGAGTALGYSKMVQPANDSYTSSYEEASCLSPVPLSSFIFLNSPCNPNADIVAVLFLFRLGGR